MGSLSALGFVCGRERVGRAGESGSGSAGFRKSFQNSREIDSTRVGSLGVGEVISKFERNRVDTIPHGGFQMGMQNGGEVAATRLTLTHIFSTIGWPTLFKGGRRDFDLQRMMTS